jgi:hypothetical protein
MQVPFYLSFSFLLKDPVLPELLESHYVHAQ